MGPDATGREPDDDQPSQTRHETDSKRLDRREYLKLSGAGLAALGGFGLGSSTVAAADEGGPVEGDGWELAFEDTFEGDSLDTSNWNIGFGWGMKANYSPSQMSEDCVEVSDDLLKLKAVQDSDGGYSIGGVNSKNKVTFEPGCFVEAKIKVHNVPGSTSAFWSKPNSEAWPPEIDFMECPTARINETMHNIHYSSSGNVGDGGTHTKATNGNYDPEGEQMHERFFVYGCEWQEDAIVHYVDGNLVGRTTDASVVGAVADGAPFYMMLNVLIGGWPPGEVPGDWSDYDTEMHVDWVRIWEQSGDGSNTDTSGGDSEGDDSSGDDSETSEDDERYLWVRSPDGTPATFEFEADNVALDDRFHQADYWVSDDATTGGGEVDRSAELPGFWVSGDITRFEYDGSLELYVANEEVDPDEFGGSGDEELPNAIVIDGSDSPRAASKYTFTVSGEVQKSSELGSLNPHDKIEDGKVTGRTIGGKDAYRFSGEITSFKLVGPADASVEYGS